MNKPLFARVTSRPVAALLLVGFVGCNIWASTDGLTTSASSTVADAGKGTGGSTVDSGKPSDGGTSTGGPVADSAAPLSYPQVVLGDSPIGYWRFRTADYDPGANTLVDVAHGNTGTTLNLNVQAGSAVGDEANGDGYGVFNPPPIGDPTNGGTSVNLGTKLYGFAGDAPFTLEAWVQPNSDAGSTDAGAQMWRSIIGRQANISSYAVPPTTGPYREGYVLWYRDVPGGPFLGFERWHLGTPTKGLDDVNILDKKFHHVVAVYTGSSPSGTQDSMALYVDGIYQGGQSDTSKLVDYEPTMYIGRSQGATDTFFYGLIDEVAIYPTALTQAQIATHFAAAKPQ